jgi:gliding motility-associated-like protein
LVNPIFSRAKGGYEVACKDGTTGVIELITSGGFGDAPTYQWTSGSGNIVNPNASIQTNLAAGRYYVSVTYGDNCIQDYIYDLHEPDSIHISLDAPVVNNPCNGDSVGIIKIKVTGGYAGTPASYTYNWSVVGGFGNGIRQGFEDQLNLYEGNYQVEVQDSNYCNAIADYSIVDPPSLQISFDTIPINCSSGTNGKITALVTGGTKYSTGYPYLYNWSTGATDSVLNNVGEGDYSVWVYDANNCPAWRAVSLTAPKTLVITHTISNYNGVSVACFGDKDAKVAIDATGGTPIYTYKWSNGDNRNVVDTLSAGMYYVEVSDKNKCSGIDSFILTEPPLLQYTYTKTDNLCHNEANGSITGTTTGGVDPYTYVWNTGATTESLFNLPTRGNGYQVAVIDANGCSDNKTIFISEPDTIHFMFNQEQSKLPFCPDAKDGIISYDITGATPGYTVTWTKDGNAISDLYNLQEGNYRYRITDGNGCIFSDTIILRSDKELCLDIPNAFSPNGDALNQFWVIFAGNPEEKNPVFHVYPDAVIEVFNRWGELVFRSAPGYPQPWDGKYRGRTLPLDSYYYVIDPKNGKRQISGIITIVR